jgi:prepilin-type N-terminal cleavage/methylation domain-containing protein
MMKIQRRRFATPASVFRQKDAGVTLIEVVMAMAILVFSSVGALSYQYYAARDASIADAQITATRLAMLLLEDWKSTGGSKDYDPSTLNLGFSSALAVPAHFSQGKGQGLGSPLHDGVYAIMIGDVPVMVMLTWTDVAEDDVSGVILRKLDATVTFDSAWESKSQKKLESLNPIILTSYVRVDEAGG